MIGRRDADLDVPVRAWARAHARATLERVSEEPSHSPHSPAERVLRRALDGATRAGAPLPRSSLERERTLEGYLLGQEPPAWMRRARTIERLTRTHEQRLAARRAELREEHRRDGTAFAAAWREVAERWDFREVNELIAAHNEWYPVERRLPIDPRSGEYVTVGGGRSYRREPLGPAWVLERFPAG